MDNQPSPFLLLQEDLVSKIISLTSPKDACRAAAVSPTLKSAVESDDVWEQFLPPDYGEILSEIPSLFHSPTEGSGCECPTQAAFCVAYKEERRDGWMELFLGMFFVQGGNDCDVRIQVCETEKLNWKQGLIVEGIEVRPNEPVLGYPH